MGEWVGVAIAVLSSCLGGTAAAITRYLTTGADPIALAVLRWGIGFVCLLPAALLLNARWPARRDLPAVALLGVCFFGLFFILYNIAISFTTAARASLALATLPLSTMLVAALLGIEKLTFRKTLGVCVAVVGVAAARLRQVRHEFGTQRLFDALDHFFLHRFHFQHTIDAVEREILRQDRQNACGMLRAQFREDDSDGLRILVLEIVRQNLFLNIGELFPHVAAGRTANFVHNAANTFRRKVLFE